LVSAYLDACFLNRTDYSGYYPSRGSIHPEQGVIHTEVQTSIDIRGTIKALHLVPGLFALIFFNTFNNFLGGVFMSLMDAYGLLVSVQVWGVLGVLEFRIYCWRVSCRQERLRKSPLRTLFLVNVVMWTICIFFTIQASIVLLAIGLFIYLCLIPVVKPQSKTSSKQ